MPNDYDRNEADEAVNVLLNELREEYGLSFPFPLADNRVAGARSEGMKTFRAAVHGLFRLHYLEKLICSAP